MELQYGPNSVDEPNLLYKLQRKIKVFNTNNSFPNRGYSLVASSSKYGIVFVGSPSGTLSVYYLKQLIDKETEAQLLSVKLPEKPTHISVSCDHELLAVTGGQLLCVYKITDFQNQNVSPSLSLKFDTNPSTFVSALQWNPCIPDSIAIALFDGTLIALQANTGQIKKVQSKARCICWSPKGKQLVTGNNDGTLCQYKPDLTPAKVVPAPNIFESAPVEALAIYWISTFQFAVVYKNATDNSRPAVTIINTPKAGQPSCLNYDDICYSMGSNRPWYYYLLGVAQWNMILSSSSNSMEIATLGSTDGANWVQWCQTDEARPELPLTDKKQENYPVGLCIDTCAIHQLPWGENETLPYMPLLHVVSQSGLLTIFNIINMNQGAVQICSPPQQFALPAAAMTNVIPDDAPAQPVQPAPTATPIVVKPQPMAPPSQPAAAPPPAFPAPASHVGPLQTSTPKPLSFQQPSLSQGFSSASIPQAAEQKQVEVKPSSIPQPQPAVVPAKPTPAQPAKPTPQAQEVNAALKAEQEKMNKMKADQELKNMLVKEVNDFQTELYNFAVKTREVQQKLQRDLDSINTNFNFQTLDTEQLKKDCALDDLRGVIIQLKLELVRACAVVAEARTHAEAKDIHQWTQADPLTIKRVSNVKKLAYYVQTQLEQAHQALEYKWNEMVSRDPQFNKPGQRMIRPILDDVYQPLVKQQEILSRQQAVLRTLRNALKECDATPMFKSTSLLRSTPFRNKDPLSKLTKNILNMSIEPQTTKPQDALFSPQKLDALRDMLSNHKPVKIKPINVELRQHLAAMRLNYEKSVKEKAAIQETLERATVKSEPINSEPLPPHKAVMQDSFQKVLAKSEPIKSEPTFVKSEPIKSEPTYPYEVEKAASVHPPIQPAAPFSVVKPDLLGNKPTISVPTFTPVQGNTTKPGMPPLSNVARTLFAEEPSKPEQLKQAQPMQQPQPVQPQPPKPQPVQPQLSKPQPVQPQPTKPQPPPPHPVQPQPAQPQIQQQAPKPLQPSFGFAPPTSITASATTRSVLKDMLQNKQGNNEAKNDSNTFMGQKICSPTVFAASSAPIATVQPPSATFTSKPISDINNMFSKFTPQAFSTKVKPQLAAVKPKSNETGEPDTPVDNKTSDIKKEEEKSITNLFGMKSPSPLANSSKNVPDVLKIPTGKSEAVTKPVEKSNEKVKENIPVKSNENIPPTSVKTEDGDKNEIGSKPSASVASSISSVSSSKEAQKQDETKVASKVTEKPTVSVNSSASSLFAAANTTTTALKSQSIFGSPTSAAPSSPTSIFGSSAPATPTTTTVESTTKSPTFSTTTTESASSIFGTAVASQSFGKVTQSGSIFATPSSTASSAFGSKGGSIFRVNNAALSSPSTLFGTSTTKSAVTTAETKSTVFSTPTTAAPSSVFGAAITTSQSAFSSPTDSVFATAKTQSSVFGAPPTSTVFGTATSTQSGSIFGSTATTQSVFGPAATTTQSVFGSSPATTQSETTATKSSSVFGSSTTTTQSVFGTTTATTQASIFGSAATSQPSVFGSATPAAPVFGTATTQASIFGTPSTPPAQGSVFGSPQTTQASVFGSPATNQTSVFGAQPTTTAQSTGSLFGGAESNLFAAASISTTSASSPTSGGSIFGGGSSGSVFGSSNTNVFGGKTAFSQSNPTAAAIFSGGVSAFGQKPATNFWGNNSTTGGFGSSGFGQQPTTQSSSIFGSSTGGSFSSPSGGQPFASPQQSSVFGSTQQQSGSAFSTSAGFGAKPTFGQPTGFGTSPPSGGFGSFGGFNKSPNSGFGGPAAFGGGATFGGSAFGSTSPSKPFGGGGTSPGFGSPTQSNATFESLATQNTLTFGNLAQQSGATPAQPAPTFNTSPSFTGWRG